MNGSIGILFELLFSGGLLLFLLRERSRPRRSLREDREKAAVKLAPEEKAKAGSPGVKN